MKSIRSKIIYFAVPALIFIVGIVLVGSKDADDTLKHAATHATVVSLNPPADLNFAGEVVPMQDFDVRERFDQQLIRYTFYHSATIMNLKLAHRWRPIIMPILKQEGIPEDFFYLCIAESHLQNLTSPAGAKGFWQFMSATGKMYDLEISKQVDERYNVIKSTYAACEYLKDAHRKFKNWTLVAASYNMGMGGVDKQMKKQKVDNYYDLYLNVETAAYVFRILAIKSILENPTNYGFDLDENLLYEPIRYKKVEVTESIPSLVDFALEHGTTYKMLKIMNPWLLQEELTVAPGKSYEIHIPRGSVIPSELVPAVDSTSAGLDSLGGDSALATPDSTTQKPPQDSLPKKLAPKDSSEGK